MPIVNITNTSVTATAKENVARIVAITSKKPKVKVMAEALAVVNLPVPCLDKNDPVNADTLSSLAHMKETDPSLYNKLMNWG